MPLLVAFGAGNVGRGLIGDIFSTSDWDVVFLDVVPEIVDTLHAQRSYIHQTVSNTGIVSRTVTRIDGRYSTDQDQVDRLISQADLVTTSVGAHILPRIAPALAHGLAARWQSGGGPIDVLLCENLHGAATVVHSLLLENLPEEFHVITDTHLGLVETSIGRMIPAVPRHERKTPTLVRAEPYRKLPYDASALKGPQPTVRGLVAIKDVPFSFYGDRKLFIHNMGHCVCAYLGELLGYEFIYQSIADPRVHSIVHASMNESACALSQHYATDISALSRHIDDLIARFANRALADTCERVGRDPIRKLGAQDRFLGAYRLAQLAGVPRSYLSLALALGTLKLSQETHWDMERARGHVELHLFGGGTANTDGIALYRAQCDSLQNGFNWDEHMELVDTFTMSLDLL